MINELLERIANATEEDGERVGTAIALFIGRALKYLWSPVVAAALVATIVHVFDHALLWGHTFLWGLCLVLLFDFLRSRVTFDDPFCAPDKVPDP